jgi:polyhydroxybutyrate depolymerase
MGTRICCLAILGLAFAFVPAAGATADVEQTIEAGGQLRSYLLHVPPGDDGKTVRPLVIVLHGGGGNARGMVRISGFSASSDREGFFLVYPNGTGASRDRLLTWNAGNCCGLALEKGVDDSGFVRKLIGALQKERKIDSSRIFATGFSNGAMMTFRLACEAADLIAAIAPVSGAFNVEPCRPARPVSVLAFYGTADQHVPYNGGVPQKQLDPHPRTDRSAAYAISFWTAADDCSAPPTRVESGSIVRELHAPCKDGTAVELITIRGGGHEWPGGEKWAPWADPPSREISANEAIWKFFAAHPKRP